jgi:hypothetical protein
VPNARLVENLTEFFTELSAERAPICPLDSTLLR